MGVMDRLRRLRHEVSELTNYSSDKTEPVTFVSELVSGEYTNKNDNTHLLHVAWEDPIAHRITVMKARAVFGDWFTIKDRDQAEEDDEEKMPELQAEFERLDARHWLTEALIGEKIFGNSALVLNRSRLRFDDGREETGPIESLNVFTPENSEIPSDSFDVNGDPAYLRCHYNASDKSKSTDVKFEDIIWFCTRPRGNSWYGYSALYPIWDDMTYLRHSKHGLGWLYQKMGLGWLIFYNRSLTAEDQVAMETMLQNVSPSRAMTVDVNRTEKVEWIGPTAASTEGLVAGVDMFLGMISAGSGVPKDIFTGASSGAISGGEMNDKAFYGEIKADQYPMEPYVRQLSVEMAMDIGERVIAWNVRYATDELEEAQIRYLHAQAAQLEMAAERGEDFTIGIKGPKEENKDNNPTGDQV